MHLYVFGFFLAIFVLSCDAKGKKDKGLKKDKNVVTCQDSTTFLMKADDFEKSGFTFKCPDKGFLSNVTVTGHNGTCQGLDQDLYVKVLNCHWLQSCNLTYKRANMLKLLTEDLKCFTKRPDTFTFTFECTAKKVNVLDLKPGKNKNIQTDKTGIIRSHEDHPWLYDREDGNSVITLKKPKDKKLKNIRIKFRTLHLGEHDLITVTFNGTTASQPRSESYIINTTNQSNLDLHFPRAAFAKLSFHTDPHSIGEIGFTVCFEWMKDRKKMSTDPCHKIFIKGNCSSPMNGKGKKRNSTA